MNPLTPLVYHSLVMNSSSLPFTNNEFLNTGSLLFIRLLFFIIVLHTQNFALLHLNITGNEIEQTIIALQDIHCKHFYDFNIFLSNVLAICQSNRVSCQKSILRLEWLIQARTCVYYVTFESGNSRRGLFNCFCHLTV